MLKLGNQGIKALYVGGQKIAKAYVGEELVYKPPAKPSHNLPAEYTELEYIQLGPNVTTSFYHTVGSLRKDSVLYIDFEVTRFPTKTSQYAKILYAEFSAAEILQTVVLLCPSYTTSTSSSAYKSKGIRFGCFKQGNVSSSNWISLTTDTNVPQRCKLTLDYPNLKVMDGDVEKATLTSDNIYVGAINMGNNKSDSTAIDRSFGTTGATVEKEDYSYPANLVFRGDHDDSVDYKSVLTARLVPRQSA